MFVVGRYNGFIEVYTAGYPIPAAVGQIPIDGVRLEHIGKSFASVLPYLYSHEVVYRYGYVDDSVGTVVPEVEIGRCAGRVLVGVQVVDNGFKSGLHGKVKFYFRRVIFGIPYF